MTFKIVLGFCIVIQFGCNDQMAESPTEHKLELKEDTMKHQERSLVIKPKVINYKSEHWVWKSRNLHFELDLLRDSDSISGKYCAIAYNGNKIDCSDDTISNYLTGVKVGNAFLVTFKSSFDSERGKDSALISYEEKTKTIVWTRKTFNIESYVPNKAILRK